MPTEIRVTATAFQTGDAAIVNRAGAPASIVLGSSAVKDESNFDLSTRTFISVGAAITLALTDRSKTLLITAATDMNVTIAAEATVNFPVGSTLSIIQTAAGIPTVVGAAGVTVNGVVAASVVCSVPFSVMTLLKISADNWIVAQ